MIAVVRLERGRLDLEGEHAVLERLERLGPGGQLGAQRRGRLVDEVDGLVGQVAVGQVAPGQAHRGVNRRVGDAHAVVELERRYQAAQDRRGQRGLRLVDGDQLEASAEAGVALDAPSVLGDRGRADAAQVAARQGGLQEIRRVAAARFAAGADQHVDLVDEQDHAPAPRDLLEQALDALLQLAAVASAGQQAPHVERAHRVVGQVLGHVSGGDALG